MTDSLDSDECEVEVLLDEARDLSLGVPGAPGLLDAAIKLGNPFLASVGGDCTIGVTRVEHHGDVGVLKYVVDPERSLFLQVVIEGFGALFPCLVERGGDVHGGARCVLVHVVRDKIAKDGLLITPFDMLEPGSVLRHFPASLILPLLAVDPCRAIP